MPSYIRKQLLRISQPRADSDLPMGIVIELVSGSLAAGTSVPDALRAIGTTMHSSEGDTLIEAGTLLQLGSPWDEAWGEVPHRLQVLRKCLVHSWEFGSPVTQSLSAARINAENTATVEAKEAAERLGVLMALPLGLCFLPSFVLLAVVPIVVSYAAGLLT